MKKVLLIEDNEEVTLDQIEDLFGQMVASIVGELTSDKDKIKTYGKAFYLLEKMLK